MSSIFNTLGDSLKELGNTLLDSFFGETKDHALSASFGDDSQLLSRRNKGFCLDGKRSITLLQSRSNTLVVAPSGKGKTQVSIFPFLLNFEGQSSLLINDVSGELAQTIPYLNSIGVRTGILDFGKKKGLYFNPLDGCKNNITQIKKIAQTLMRASQGNEGKKDFWSISGADCLTLFIQFVIESEETKYQNLANVYRLILEYQGSPKTVQMLIAKKASPEVWSKFKSLSGTSENTRKSIIASALAALSFIGDDPVLCDITSHTNINFQDFRERPHALFVQVPVSDTSYYAPILSLFFQEFYRFAFSKIPLKDELDIMMVLDEFDTLTAISDFSSIISNSRKFGIPQLLILQGESQLSKYGEQAKTILNNCNVKCYYGGLTEETYNLEKTLGKFEYHPDEKNKNFTKERSLLTASEIRELDGEILILPSGAKPLKVKVTECYKQRKLMRRLVMEPIAQEGKILKHSVTYIPLDTYRKTQNNTNPKTN